MKHKCQGTPGAASWGRCEKPKGHAPPCTHDVDPKYYESKPKRNPLAGFLHPADAIVPCKACGAAEGVPCKSIAKDRERLKPGFVHFGRRLRRFLLTGAARGDQRKRFEDEAVKMLRKWLAERQSS